MAYNTIIFDLDGTLLNTIEDLTDSLNYALNKKGFSSYQIEEVKHFVGSGVKVMVEKALKNNQEAFPEVYQTFLAHYSKNNCNKTRLYDGVLSTIKKLSQMKIKMAIVSNKYQQAVLDICQPLLGKYIKVMIGEQPNLKKKPDSDMVLYAIKLLHSSQDQCAYLGDSEIDFLTAQNAHLDFIGAAWGFRGRKFLEDLGSQFVIDEFSDLLKLVETQNF